MSHIDVFEVVNRLMIDLKENNSPFGDITILLGGDFRQPLSVIRLGSRAASVNALISKAPSLWRHFQIFKLTENMRTGSDQLDFARWLLDVGNESADIPGPDLLNLLHLQLSNTSNFRKQVYSNKISSETDISGTAILTPLNTTSLKAKIQCLILKSGPTTTYLI
jgi:PIF1-like helicase